jgi:hypothetical protein
VQTCTAFADTDSVGNTYAESNGKSDADSDSNTNAHRDADAKRSDPACGTGQRTEGWVRELHGARRVADDARHFRRSTTELG